MNEIIEAGLSKYFELLHVQPPWLIDGQEHAADDEKWLSDPLIERQLRIEFLDFKAAGTALRAGFYRYLHGLALIKQCNYQNAFSVGAHEHREAAMAFLLIHRYRGPAGARARLQVFVCFGERRPVKQHINS